VAEMTDDDVLELERVQRAMKGSPELKRWERAQYAFEFWREKVVVGAVRPAWEDLPGLERAVWHALIVNLDSTCPARDAEVRGTTRILTKDAAKALDSIADVLHLRASDLRDLLN
jgi:hypothetical protein